MAKLLEGKVAIVTGAGRGLGRSEAMMLAANGAKVVVNDLGSGFDGAGDAKGPADEVVAEIKSAGGEAVANYDSVSDFNSAKRMIDCAIESFGQLNILVNNAGILRDRMLFNMSEEEFDSVVSVHLKGTFNTTRHSCAYWREEHKAGRVHNGRLIHTTSDAGLLGNASQSNYGAAKAAIAGFSLIISQEMAKYEVTSNCVAPVARTRLTTDATPQFAAMMNPPEGGGFDTMNPDHMAVLVTYLASDLAKDVTGDVFRLMGNKVWLLGGWHTVDQVAKEKAESWTVEELNTAIHDMRAKAPPKPVMAQVIMGM